jgi:hypothetical protein
VTVSAVTGCRYSKRIVQLSFFFLRRSFFACSHGAVSPCLNAPTQRGAYSTNEVDRTNILAPGFVPATAGFTFFPPSPFSVAAAVSAAQPRSRRRHACHYNDWPNSEVVSSYSSATAPDSHGISCADPLFQARKELDREVAACARRCKNYLINLLTNPFLCHQLTLA